MHLTALRINKKSFNNGDYYVGMEGLDVTFTYKPEWTIKTEMIVDGKGHPGLRVWHKRVDN
ncbi:MAG: hypothetical protein SCG72_05130 [Nitrosarchaeum sp.]|nr:hypothetical protein [Nitrosarchaeum sp.]